MTTDRTTDKVALVTGGTAGLGLALCAGLADAGWRVLTDGRTDRGAPPPRGVRRLTGDIVDPDHVDDLVAAVTGLGRLDLLVHNASTLGPLPMGPLARATTEDLQHVWLTNVGAPVALTGALLPLLQSSDGVLISLSSDAAVEHYETWGPYGASKAALDHVTLTFAAEAGIAGYAVDPGDMRTGMHQDAFPGEDISDRPEPQTVVPHLMALLERRPEPGRYRAREVAIA